MAPTAAPTIDTPEASCAATVRVAVCDDHAAIATAIGQFLAGAPGGPPLDVVATALSAEGLLAGWRRGEVDVVILDMSLGPRDHRAGLDLARRLRVADPDVRILFYSATPEPALVREAMDAGAAGYVSKCVASGELADAVRRVAADERPVFDAATATDLALAAMQVDHVARLSPREHEVLEQVASGLTNASIGRRLGISENSVKSLLRRALGKLDAADRASAVAKGFRLGLLH